MNRFLAVASFSALLAAPSIALAEVEHPWSTYIGGGALFFEADEEDEPGQVYGIRQGYDTSEDFTLETGLTFGPFFQGTGFKTQDDIEGGDDWSAGAELAALYHLKGNPVHTMDDPTGEIDPYTGAVAGIRWFKRDHENGHWDPLGALSAGANYFVNDKWIVRGDYQLQLVGHDTEINHQVLALLGYRWGDEDAATGKSKGAAIDDPLSGRDLGLQTIYFAFDSDALTPVAKEKLNSNAEWIKANPDAKIILEGHCDERGTNEYNLGLGQRRAESALEYLRALGVPTTNIDTVSFGEERPAVAESNEAAWAKNRRVELVGQE